MRAVVTGATGMIGRALVNEIQQNGDEAIVLVNPDSKRQAAEGARVIFCGLQDYRNFLPDFQADVFFHLAWGKTGPSDRDDREVQQANVRYTLDAVDLAHKAGCNVFVGAGSQAEYGVQSVPLRGDTPARPESEYGKAKLEAGALARERCAAYGMRFNWCRILSVFGKGDNEGTLISYLIRCMRAGEPPVLTKCEQTWDYLYAEDCARALYLVAKKGTDKKIYPLGSGKPRKLRDYVLDIAEEIGYNKTIGFGEKAYYPHQPMFLYADISELTADTGFMPRYTFREGIRKLLY